MGIEIEKKYRMTQAQRERVIARLHAVGAEDCGEEFEENTLYGGGSLDVKKNALRLRKVGERVILTYKERDASASAIKHQREDETRVEDGAAMDAILDALGYQPALVYEKRRRTFRLPGIEVVIDELPFGLYLEIEGEDRAILEAEKQLELDDLDTENATYPQLTEELGNRVGEMIEVRFSMRD